MTDHPITPSPELIAKWAGSMCGYYEAARWGSDQELEACCEWLNQNTGRWDLLAELRAARRPKPPSLKESAIAVLDDCSDKIDAAHENIIRLALQALPD